MAVFPEGANAAPRLHATLTPLLCLLPCSEVPDSPPRAAAKACSPIIQAPVMVRYSIVTGGPA